MPTIVICGTPGTGKSSIIDKLRSKLPDATYINLSKFAIENACTDGFDARLESHIIDDEKLADKLEPLLDSSRLNILESIHVDHFDSEIVDKVFVVRTDTTRLFDRLQARGYNQDKVTNNVEAEIFQQIYDEAIADFGMGSVIELKNNDDSDLEENVSLICREISNLLRSQHN